MYLTAISEVCVNGGEYLVLDNTVQYDSERIVLRTIPLANVDHMRTNCLVRERTARFFA